MNILQELNGVLSQADIPVETGVFSGVPPDEYLVITPLSDSFAVFGDNRPQVEVQEARLSLFSKQNYLVRMNQLVRLLLQADLVITERRYMGHEDDTSYHHYAMDVAKEYRVEE